MNALQNLSSLMHPNTAYVTIYDGSGCSLTCFGVDGKVRLALEDAVDHSSAVAISGVICICGCHLCNVRPCGREREGTLTTQIQIL